MPCFLATPKDTKGHRPRIRYIGQQDELNRRMNETWRRWGAIFKSWFVDFDPVRAKVDGRKSVESAAAAALFPDGLEESELGRIPMAGPSGSWRRSM